MEQRVVKPKTWRWALVIPMCIAALFYYAANSLYWHLWERPRLDRRIRAARRISD